MTIRKHNLQKETKVYKAYNHIHNDKKKEPKEHHYTATLRCTYRHFTPSLHTGSQGKCWEYVKRCTKIASQMRVWTNHGRGVLKFNDKMHRRKDSLKGTTRWVGRIYSWLQRNKVYGAVS